jgi:hypothetical protein
MKIFPGICRTARKDMKELFLAFDRLDRESPGRTGFYIMRNKIRASLKKKNKKKLVAEFADYTKESFSFDGMAYSYMLQACLTTLTSDPFPQFNLMGGELLANFDWASDKLVEMGKLDAHEVEGAKKRLREMINWEQLRGMINWR